MDNNISTSTRWSGVVKNFNRPTTLKLTDMSSSRVEKLQRNYIKYGIIDYDILDYPDQEIERMMEDYAVKKDNDENNILIETNNELRKRFSDLSIENMVLKRTLGLTKSKLKDQTRLDKYIEYLENYADQVLVDNYRDPIFYDNSLNQDNFDNSDEYFSDENLDDYDNNEYSSEKN